MLINMNEAKKYFCEDGQIVDVVHDSAKNEIIIIYKNRCYRRPSFWIGLFLFEKDPTENKKNKTVSLGPDDCLVYKKGDCGAIDCDPNNCPDFKKAPRISKEELESWPSYGDATYYRLHSYKRH